MAEPKSVQHREIGAPEALRPFVRRLLNTYSDGSVHYSACVPPTGACYLTHVYGSPMRIQFADGAWQRCPPMFIGAQLKREMPLAEIRGQIGLLGVELTSTALYRLFGLDCRALTDQTTRIEDAFPEDGRGLVDALLSQPVINAKVRLIAQFLGRRIGSAAPPSRVDRAIARIEQERGAVAVEQLAEECAWSPRQLHRRFLTEVGIGPKLYAKIVQVNVVVAAIRSGGDKLQDVAQDSGYYDQAQFVHDFQRLVGVTPMRFLRNRDPFLKMYLGRSAVRADDESSVATEATET